MKKLTAWMIAAGALMAGCCPPSVNYPYTPSVVQKRSVLQGNLLQLLPEAQRALPAAAEEARWISDTAYKASAGISRVNGSCLPGWFGNALVNIHLQDRGLCWQYQHDLFRELRRRHLEYFRLGCCVRDYARPSEHNCVYVSAKGAEWPDAWILDAWKWNGRLTEYSASEVSPKRWVDIPAVCHTLEKMYPECHALPIEHWGILRDQDSEYALYWESGMPQSRQYQTMLKNIEKGKKTHPGSLINY